MLTKSEEEIMYLLWDLDEPLTSSEIVKKAVNKTWKKSYINLLINSLLKKDMIKVVGVKQMTKNYAQYFCSYNDKGRLCNQADFGQTEFCRQRYSDSLLRAY